MNKSRDRLGITETLSVAVFVCHGVGRLVSTPQMGNTVSKKSRQNFNRKSISRDATHRQSQNLQAMLTGETLKS